jgi:hypothetical protein
MQKGLMLVSGAVIVMATIIVCPESIRADAARRVAVPEHVYVEAERQLDFFISWARQEDQTPEQYADSEIPA